jgi:hypothetical protein
MPATPVISVSGEPFSSRAPSLAAISRSCMEQLIVNVSATVCTAVLP